MGVDIWISMDVPESSWVQPNLPIIRQNLCQGSNLNGPDFMCCSKEWP